MYSCTARKNRGYLSRRNRTAGDVEVYISEIIIDGDDIAVEWQFASTPTPKKIVDEESEE